MSPNDTRGREGVLAMFHVTFFLYLTDILCFYYDTALVKIFGTLVIFLDSFAKLTENLPENKVPNPCSKKDQDFWNFQKYRSKRPKFFKCPKFSKRTLLLTLTLTLSI